MSDTERSVQIPARIDLHAHSNRSDGTDDPVALVQQAQRAGLDTVALTDHDTFDGLDDAQAAADRTGIRLVPGVEISCRLDGRGVHLLGYFADAGHQPLLDELARVRRGRDGRVPQVVERLRAAGLDITVDDVANCARTASSLGRPHIADALVAKGYVPSRRAAFDRWLAEGRPAYVARYAPSPEQAIALVVAAGGVAVLAHPRGRASRDAVTDTVIARLGAAGLSGIEVDHHDHDPPTRSRLRALAGELGLITTGASDYHGTGKQGHALGSELTAPVEFDRLLAAVPGAERHPDPAHQRPAWREPSP